MKQSPVSSSFIVLVVIVFHLVLGWLLTQSSFQKPKIDNSFDNLQMVELNLGEAGSVSIVDESSNAEDQMTEVQSSPEPVSTVTSVSPQQNEVNTTQVQTTVADIQEKPQPRKLEPTKNITPKSEPTNTSTNAAVNQNEPIVPGSTSPVNTKSSTLHASGSKTSGSNQMKGPNSIQNKPGGGTGTQSNSSTTASLGAGFGSTMTGACSDLSDDADDEGRVKLKVTVNAQGKATNVQIQSGSGLKRLDNQAKSIAKNHSYSPATKNGQAVADDVVFTIDFKCGNAA